MPHAVHVGNLLHKVEGRSNGVAQAAHHQQRERHRVERLQELRQTEHHEPAHDEIDEDGHPTRLTLAADDLERHASERERPHHDEQHDAAIRRERDEAKRRIATSDEQVDAAVVDNAENAFGRGHLNGMVERGSQVL